MSVLRRSPGLTAAVLGTGALCFGAAYLGGTLTRSGSPVARPAPAQSAAAPPAIPAGRVRPLAGAEQIPGLRVPRVVHHRPTAPPAATPGARATVVARAAAPARTAPARTVAPQTQQQAPAPSRPQPQQVPVSQPSPPPSTPKPQPAASKPATKASTPVTFFDDGQG